jgi:hypothetical protein
LSFEELQNLSGEALPKDFRLLTALMLETYELVLIGYFNSAKEELTLAWYQINLKIAKKTNGDKVFGDFKITSKLLLPLKFNKEVPLAAEIELNGYQYYIHLVTQNSY